MSAKATAIFEADDSRFSAALLNINRKMLALQRSVAHLAVGFGVLKKGAEWAGKGAAMFADAVEVGAKLNHLSLNTGIAVKDLQILQQQFLMAGKSAEDVGPVMAKMMKGITTGSAAGTIKRLGLDMEKLRKQSAADQFTAIGTAIKRLPDTAQRATAAMELFGKSGASMLAVFESGNFNQAAALIGAQADILNRDAALFADVSAKLQLAGLKVQGFFIGVADKVAPVLRPLLDQFAALDLAAMGQQAGDAVATFIQAFSDGTLGDILLTSMQIAFSRAANFLMRLLLGLGNMLAQILIEAAQGLLTVLQISGTADFWKGLGAALLSIAARFNAMILDTVATLIEKLSGIPLIGDKIQGGAQTLRTKASAIRADADMLSGYSAEKWQPAFDAIKERVMAGLQNIAQAPGRGFHAGVSLIDTSGMSDHLDDLIGSAMENVQKAHESALQELPTKPLSAPLGDDFDGKPVFSRLQKIGGGGYAAGGDPLLSESRQQTRELRELNRAVKTLAEKQPRSIGAPIPVFS